jgi:hypothetical protein
MKRSSFNQRRSRPIERSESKRDALPAISVARDEARARQATKTIRRLERLIATAAAGDVETTPWESDLLVDLKERVGKYGRAFANEELGNLSMPLSFRQAIKVRQIHSSIKKQQDQNNAAKRSTDES